jgi:2,3-bisphosphoglycerate-dependent phosphoglycerate mutase
MSTNTVNLVLVRHGQSQWNLENRFTGWVDVELTELGITEAKRAARELKKLDIKFAYSYCSVLKRSIHTLWHILQGLELSWLPCDKSWRLNERHYGALQGLNKKETAEKYGDDQVKIWRRSYDTLPPLLKSVDEDPKAFFETFEKPNESSKYSDLEKYELLGLGKNDFPKGESLQICQQRVVPYFETIKTRLKKGENILVVAHGNSLRSLIMEIEGLNGETIMNVEVETAVPIVYTLDLKTLKPLDKKILKII